MREEGGVSHAVRLDIYVAEREGISRSASQKLIEKGLVTVNGAARDKNYRLCAGDEVEVDYPEPIPDDTLPEPIPLDIVYEDDCMLVVNKPKGMVVHPAPGNLSGTLVNALLYHCGNSLSGINGVVRPGIVHRIDRDTSGLLMVAKNDAAHLFLASQLKERHLERVYNAVVTGGIRDDEGTVNAPIGRHPTDRRRMAVVKNGREAVTHYRVIDRFERYTLLELRLETGRTHQIRVHMAYLGHPVLGDPVYGGDRDPFARRNSELLAGQCLHARSIAFLHPESGALMRFDCGLPDYFEKILDKLRKNNE